MSLTAGTRLGPYQILAELGKGGMGEVYKATDSRLGRDVAIKILPSSFADDPDRRARFEREAQAVAALSHPNVIAIFDTGVHTSADSGHAHLYVVMELLTGQTLRERLATGAMPVRKAVDTAVQIARGLGAAHGKGIVHRDLKPENIFLLDDGQVKILDFGLARQAAAVDSSGATQTMAMTGAGTVMGTVGYMAPEQVRGLVVDARADVFSFGAVLYEMVSGQRAFQRDTAADSMTAILTQDPPERVGARPDVSPAIDRIIRHCLEKNANERFQNARDIAFALEALSGSVTSQSSGAVAAMDVAGRAQKPRASVVMMMAVAGALVVGAGAGYVGRSSADSASVTGGDVSYQPASFEDGFVFTARFAPDGRTIVYSADWDRQPRGVFMTSLDNLEYRLLGFPGADLLGVSRTGELAVLNGSQITGGNSYWRVGTLAKGSMTGGSSRAELEGVRFADFGSNGAMAVVREDGRRSTVEYPVGQVLAEGTVAAFRGGAFAAPRVSPSGEHVAFFDLSVLAAYTVKVFHRSGTLVTESQPFSDWWALAWTPANEVWFAAAEASGSQTSIFSLDLAGKERMIWRAPGAITLHDISPQGDVLASFDRGSERIELIDAPRAAPIARSWREAGRLSAFSSNHTLLISGYGDSAGPSGSVYIWVPGDAQPVRIADGIGVALSPDGKKALVVAREAPLKVSIVPTGAGQPQALDIGPMDSVTWAGWLPDGRLVIQSGRKGAGPTVSIVSEAGGAPVELLPSGITLTGTNLISPDGSLIAAIDGQSRPVVCTVAAPAACRSIPGTEIGDNVAGWTADGKSMVTYRSEAGTAKVEHVDVTTGRRTAVTTIRPLAAALSGFRAVFAAPDGALAYSYSRAASQLYVIRGLK